MLGSLIISSTSEIYRRDDEVYFSKSKKNFPLKSLLTIDSSCPSFSASNSLFRFPHPFLSTEMMEWLLRLCLVPENLMEIEDGGEYK